MESMTFVIEGEVNVQITVTEMGDGTLKFDIAVLDDTGSIGDLNGIFFDLADDSITDGLSVTGDDVTETAFKADGVTKVDSYVNMNGEVVKEYGKFDAGIQFGTAGIGTDDIRETSFILSSDTGDLSLTDIAEQDFGLRLTSVGEEGGSRDGSLKLGGTAPEEDPDIPPPPPDEDPDIPPPPPDEGDPILPPPPDEGDPILPPPDEELADPEFDFVDPATDPSVTLEDELIDVTDPDPMTSGDPVIADPSLGDGSMEYLYDEPAPEDGM